jgi:hypothetical protein
MYPYMPQRLLLERDLQSMLRTVRHQILIKWKFNTMNMSYQTICWFSVGQSRTSISWNYKHGGRVNLVFVSKKKAYFGSPLNLFFYRHIPEK